MNPEGCVRRTAVLAVVGLTRRLTGKHTPHLQRLASSAEGRGLRALLEVVLLDATLVRGSHGRVPEDPDDWPVFIGQDGGGKATRKAQEIHGLLLAAASGPVPP